MILKIGNKTGKHRIELKRKNIQRVREYFLKHPGNSIADCMREIGLCRQTIARHIKTIQGH